MKTLFPALCIAAGLAAAVTVPAGAAPGKPHDVCVAAPTGGGSFNMFVFRDVEPLNPGRAVTLRGLYFATSVRKIAPLHGSAAMASDGTVRLGFFVHSTAESTNDFTVAGITDATFAGTVSFDNDGDFVPNGTLAMEPVDCATVTIP